MLNKIKQKFRDICLVIKASPREGILFALLVVALLILALVWFIPDNSNQVATAKQEINELGNIVRNYYKVRPDYWGLSTANAIKNNLVPAKMVRGNKIISALGKEINVGQDVNGTMIMPGGKRFIISINNISKSVCVAMLPDSSAQAGNPALTAINLISGDKVFGFEWGGQLPLPITKELADKYCQNNNTISWTFE